MNREILFRGKRVDNGEWVHGKGLQQCKDELGNEIVAIFTDIVKSEKYIKKEGRYTLYYMPVKAETLGQYTGLKDKNGKKVFEGDLLEVANRKRDKECIADVIFLDGAFLLHFPNEDLLDIKEVSECWVVIGNIHDNPV